MSDAAQAGFDIKWIELAKGNNQQVEHWIAEYDNNKIFIADEDIEKWAAGKGEDDRAAFLESRKAALYKGATAEFSKLEGVNINFSEVQSGQHRFLYLSVSNIDHYMADQKGDIQLQQNDCGAVYQFPLSKDYNVSRMQPIVVGRPSRAGVSGYACEPHHPANPDNLAVLDAGRLVIGEDSSKKNHKNNMVWLYTPSSP
jgi:secreted PhoX family phosphatase